jgi:hypothetical protein
MEATLVPKGGQRDEGGEEARIVLRAHGQDPSKCGKAGGDAQESNLFCAYIQKTLRD